MKQGNNNGTYDAGSRERAVAEVIAHAGHLDVLVNNAGVSLIAPLVEAPFDRVKNLADAILAKHPPRVIRGGRGSTTYQTAARLPPSVRDFFLRREFGLPSKRTDSRS